MKSLTVLIIAIVLTSALMSSAPTTAWHTPCSTEDYLFEKFGPRPGNLTYLLNDADFQAFLNGEIDIMDRYLTVDEFRYLETIDPLHEQYSTAFTWDFALYQIDINNVVVPTVFTSVRQALSHIIDKQYFIDTYLSGMGHKADSPCAHAPGWYNPGCNDMYNLQPRPDFMDIEIAYDLLVADIGPPVPDPEDPNYYMWLWPSPWPDVRDGYLLMWAPSPDPVRIQLANYVKESLESYLPSMLELLGKPRARIHVDLRVAPPMVIYVEVMVNRHFHLYTGALALTREPYHGIGDWTGASIPGEWNLGLMANRTFPASEPGTASYYIWKAQEIIMSEAAVIPMWNPGGYKAYLSKWRGMVNEAGIGVNNQWSFLNAHWQFSASNDTIRYGVTTSDLISTNIIAASWRFDHEVLGNVYDTLISFNPYNFTEDIGRMAKKWNLDISPIEIPFATFHLRSDMYWQDIPPFMWRKYGIFPFGVSRVRVTPIDVAFSIIYVRDTPGAWNQWLVSDVAFVEISPCWENWRVTSETPPFNASYPYGHGPMSIMFNPGLDPWELRIWYLPSSFLPWQDRLHKTGALPIIPYHIWWWVPNWDENGNGVEDVFEYDPWLDDTLYGCGPYIFVSHVSQQKIVMLPFREGIRYKGIISSRSYFNYVPVQICYPEPFQKAISLPNKPIFFMPCNVKTWLWGYNLYIEFAVVNFMAVHNFDLSIGMGCIVTNIDLGESISALRAQDYMLTGYTLRGEWYKVFRWSILLPLSWRFNDHLTVDVHLTVTITGPDEWPGEIANTWVNWGHECWPTWPGNCALIKLKLTPGDITGDGVVNIWDATMIGLWWMYTVPPAPPEVDQNCDNVINIWDATIVALNWLNVDP